MILIVRRPGPLALISCHILQAPWCIALREAAHRRRAGPAVVFAQGNPTVPVEHLFVGRVQGARAVRVAEVGAAAGDGVIAPRVDARAPALGGVLPLHRRRQHPAHPLAEINRGREVDAVHRVVAALIWMHDDVARRYREAKIRTVTLVVSRAIELVGGAAAGIHTGLVGSDGRLGLHHPEAVNRAAPAGFAVVYGGRYDFALRVLGLTAFVEIRICILGSILPQYNFGNRYCTRTIY